MGIATLLDPAVSATVAATGLYLREGNPIEDLACDSGREVCCNVRQKSVVKAKSRVPQKISNEGRSGGISPCWIALVTEAPCAWCNGIGRYTLLRWAVNQDDDVWLSMRGTRHQQKCGSCGLPGDTFPLGLYHPPCEACVRASGTNVWSIAPWSLQLCQAYTAESPQDPMKAWMQDWDIMPAHDVVCRACGCGDNTVGHWTRWCVVPLIVAIAVLKPDHVNLTMCQLACQSPRHAVICTLILSCFRRLLRQEGAFLHQQAAEAKSVLWWISKLHESVARDAHVQLHVDFPISPPFGLQHYALASDDWCEQG